MKLFHTIIVMVFLFVQFSLAQIDTSSNGLRVNPEWVEGVELNYKYKVKLKVTMMSNDFINDSLMCKVKMAVKEKQEFFYLLTLIPDNSELFMPMFMEDYRKPFKNAFGEGYNGPPIELEVDREGNIQEIVNIVDMRKWLLNGMKLYQSELEKVADPLSLRLDLEKMVSMMDTEDSYGDAKAEEQLITSIEPFFVVYNEKFIIDLEKETRRLSGGMNMKTLSVTYDGKKYVDSWEPDKLILTDRTLSEVFALTENEASENNEITRPGDIVKENTIQYQIGPSDGRLIKYDKHEGRTEGPSSIVMYLKIEEVEE